MGRCFKLFILSSILTISVIFFGLLTYMLSCQTCEPETPCDRGSFGKQRFARRGFVSYHQENTIGAIVDAYTNGYEAEFDVQLTSDSEMVVFRDASTYRLTGEDKIISSMTLDEVSELRIPSRIEQKVFDSEGVVPTYKDMLAAICTPGNEDRSFQVNIRAKNEPPTLSSHDEDMAKEAVRIWNESPCTSKKTIFAVTHPSQGHVIKEELDALSAENYIAYQFVPGDWTLGEDFWLKSRRPFLVAQASVVQVHHLLWENHNETIAKISEAGWCVGSFGEGSIDEMLDVETYSPLVPSASWDLIGKHKINEVEVVYNEDADNWAVVTVLIVFFCMAIITAIPNLVYVIRDKDDGGNQVTPVDSANEDEAPAPAEAQASAEAAAPNEPETPAPAPAADEAAPAPTTTAEAPRSELPPV